LCYLYVWWLGDRFIRFRSETPHFDSVWSRIFCKLLPVIFISSLRKAIKIHQYRNEIFLSARTRSSGISSIIRVTNCGYLSRRMPSRDDPLLQGVMQFLLAPLRQWLDDGRSATDLVRTSRNKLCQQNRQDGTVLLHYSRIYSHRIPNCDFRLCLPSRY